MSQFEKIAGGSGSLDRPVHPTAAWIMVLGIFMERFVFYGTLSILSLYFTSEISNSTYWSYRGLMVPFMGVASVLLGFLSDFLIEKRLLIVAGATLNAMGLILITARQDEVAMVGMAMVVVGVAAARLGNFSYFGYLLSNRFRKIEGGFSFAFLAVNLGAFLSSVAVAFLADLFGYRTSIACMGVLGVCYGMLISICGGMGLLPSTGKLSGTRNPSGVAQAIAIVVMLMLVGNFIFIFAIAPSRVWKEWGELVTIITFVSIYVGGYVVYALSAGADAVRRNLIQGLLMLLVLSMFTAINLAGDLFYQLQSAELGITKENVQVCLTAFLLLVIGSLLMFGNSDPRRGYAGASIRLFIGVVLAAASTSLYLLLPSVGTMVIWLTILVGAVGESLWNSLAFATSWSISPFSRKGTAIALMTASGGMSFQVANFFDPRSIDIGGKPDWSLPIVGIIIFSAMAILVGWMLMVALSNHPLRSEDADVNPFA